jgi:tRNA1(Val) A37 N6-methylase TrmN6
MSVTDDARFKGWLRPGPRVPGGVDVEDGETLDWLCGHFRIFQYERGHRFSADDVLCAWYATSWAPRVERACDLGSGIGSVALSVAWRLPGCRIVTVEAQDISVRLAKKSVAYNGVADRFTILHGDLRDPHVLDGPLDGRLEEQGLFDLVTGSPPYWPEGSALAAAHPQAVPARLEVRGDVADYARTAARILAPGGVFACVFQASQDARVRAALVAAGLTLIRTRAVRFKAGVAPEVSGIRLYVAGRAVDLPAGLPFPIEEPPLCLRARDGLVDPEYAAVRLGFGFPPGLTSPRAE